MLSVSTLQCGALTRLFVEVKYPLENHVSATLSFRTRSEEISECMMMVKGNANTFDRTVEYVSRVLAVVKGVVLNHICNMYEMFEGTRGESAREPASDSPSSRRGRRVSKRKKGEQRNTRLRSSRRLGFTANTPPHWSASSWQPTTGVTTTAATWEST